MKNEPFIAVVLRWAIASLEKSKSTTINSKLDSPRSDKEWEQTLQFRENELHENFSFVELGSWNIKEEAIVQLSSEALQRITFDLHSRNSFKVQAKISKSYL